MWVKYCSCDLLQCPGLRWSEQHSCWAWSNPGWPRYCCTVTSCLAVPGAGPCSSSQCHYGRQTVVGAAWQHSSTPGMFIHIPVNCLATLLYSRCVYSHSCQLSGNTPLLQVCLFTFLSTAWQHSSTPGMFIHIPVNCLATLLYSRYVYSHSCHIAHYMDTAFNCQSQSLFCVI